MNEQEALLNYVCQSSPEVNIILSLKSATIIQYTIKGRFMSR